MIFFFKVIEEHEDLKSRMGVSRPDLRQRRFSGRKRNHDESEYSQSDYSQSQSYSQSATQYSKSEATYTEEKTSESEEEDTVKENSDALSESSASTIVQRGPTKASMMASQALTNVTALSKR